jgi:putative ABC transport system substrate-binding protein
MRKNRDMRFRFFLCGFVWAFLTILPLGQVHANENGIAIVHSYHKDFKWVQEVNKGIQDYLNYKKIFNITPKHHIDRNNISYFYLDAKNHQNDKRYLKKKGRSIISELETLKPKVVVISDDEALLYVARPLLNRADFKFVFLGVNNDPREYDVVSNLHSPEYNITGLVSEHPFLYSIKLITQTFPNYENIFVFFDDSMSGKGIHDNLIKHAEMLDKSIRDKLRPSIITNDWRAWKHHILANQSKNNIFIFGTFYTLRDENGRTLSEREVISWILEHSKVPELTIVSSHIVDGFLVSISNPGYVHGYEAMNYVERLMAGEKISDLPIGVPREKAVRVNMRRAESIGATIPVEIIAMSRYFEDLGY